MQLWSQICDKMAKLVQKTTLEKFKKQKKIKAENMKPYFFFQTHIMDIFSNISPNQRPHYQNSFS